MKIHQLTVDEALRSLQSDPAGLSADKAASRLVEFGPNQVVRARRESVLWQFSKEFIHFFALILKRFVTSIVILADKHDALIVFVRHQSLSKLLKRHYHCLTHISFQ